MSDFPTLEEYIRKRIGVPEFTLGDLTPHARSDFESDYELAKALHDFRQVVLNLPEVRWLFRLCDRLARIGRR